MKTLLTMNLPYFPAIGGANKANKAVLEGLSRKGHDVLAVVPAFGTPSRIVPAELIAELRKLGIRVDSEGGVFKFEMNGVKVHAIREPERLRAHLLEEIRRFKPDSTLVSLENPSQSLLDAVLKAGLSSVACIAQATTFLPFGPDSYYPSARRTELLRRADLVIAISRFLAGYMRRWGGLDPELFYMPSYGSGPFPNHGCFERGFVTMVNPCQSKGLVIFASLAREFPDLQFAAVPTWGTTEEDMKIIRSLPNVSVLEPTLNFDQILSRTRILLMPSLANESLGQTVIEAMLCGIPVLASNLPGLAEAKLGTDYLLPVRPIEHYADRLDSNEIPVPLVPHQDITPWRDALSDLLASRELYEAQSEASREAAITFVSRLTVDPLEALLLKNMKSKHVARAATGGDKMPGQPDRDVRRGMADLTPEQRALLMLRLRRKNNGRAEENPRSSSIRRASREKPIRLSFGQQRLWFAHQLQPHTSAFNQPMAVRLQGRLDIAALERTLSEIVRRHEILRTTFELSEGVPVQIISPPQPMPLPLADLSLVREETSAAEVERVARREGLNPFDLSKGPLIRGVLIKVGEEDHVVMLSMHHIISDGWSMNLLVSEVSRLYGAYKRGEEVSLEPLEIQYADYAQWQQEWLEGEAYEEQMRYWKERLAGAPALLDLPTDFARPSERTARGATRLLALPEALTARLKELAHRENVTLFMLLLAVFDLLLHRYTGQTDIVIGTPIAGRNRIETEKLIGFFLNALILRTDVSNNPSFRELLQKVRRATIEAFANQDVPFEKIVEELKPERSSAYSPLYQVLFSLNNVTQSSLQLESLTLSTVKIDFDAVRFDLALYGEEREEELILCLQYSTDLFRADTIELMLRQYQSLIEAILSDPARRLSELLATPREEHRRLIMDFNDDL